MFGIFDIGRYAITMHSLKMLANAEARANMINCYTPAVLANPPSSPSGCTGDYLSPAQKKDAAPFLYGPTVNTVAGTGVLTITASLPSFKVLMPILWGKALDAPSVSTSIPF
jgi:hypothetical protein